jgi:hypothetical protein
MPLLSPAAQDQASDPLSVASYPSIQAAIDANPGKMLFVPDREYLLTDAIQIRQGGSGLYGFGKLVQQNTNEAIVQISNTADVRLRDLTLTRAAGHEQAHAPALVAINCTNLWIAGLRVQDNRAPSGAIALRQCAHATVSDCCVENYSTIAVDDRSAGPLYGIAFNCIDGTGITASNCKDLVIQRNRIIENHTHPSPEMKERFQLGKIIKRTPQRGLLTQQKVWDRGWVENWHQGSGIAVTGPEETSCVRILENHIENAAQGIDIHADNVIVSGNIVINAFMGMKAMHGARNVQIVNNQFIRVDLWAIGLMSGASSHGAQPARENKPARGPNVDGGHIVANNLITDFGYGDSHWIWHTPENNCTPFRFDNGQTADEPPLHDVLVTGNLVYNSGADQVLSNGVPQTLPPRYRWAVYISQGKPSPPVGLKFGSNLFHPGTEGISNIPLEAP